MSGSLPKVSTRYGAPMGRRSDAYLATEGGALQLFKVRLNAGGYDRGGAYWGTGSPLWCVRDVDGNARFLRAEDRASAKRQTLADWPDATFHR